MAVNSHVYIGVHADVNKLLMLNSSLYISLLILNLIASFFVPSPVIWKAFFSIHKKIVLGNYLLFTPINVIRANTVGGIQFSLFTNGITPCCFCILPDHF